MKTTQAFQSGFRIEIHVSGFPNHLIPKLTQPNRVIVVSGNLKHERKMTQLHMKF